MLGKTYEYDAVPTLYLNELQSNMKYQIEQKILIGEYAFEKVDCCICKGKGFEVLASKDRYGLYMPVVICKQCGLIQTNPRMNQESYNKFYDNEYRKLYVGKESPSQEFFYEQYLRGKHIYSFIQKKTASLRKGLFVFEVGCGAGGILQYFKEKGCEVKGVDLGYEYLTFGKKNYGLDLTFGTIKDVKLDKKPDVIIYSHVLEHILNPIEELNSVYNIIAPNGLLYIEVPGVKNLMRNYEMNFLIYLQNAHTYHFTLTSIKNLLEISGFEFVTGDETIKSIFKKKQKNMYIFGSKSLVKNDYCEVLSYLLKIEKLKKYKMFAPYKLAQLPLILAKNFLRTLGIYDYIRTLYRKIKL